MLPKGLKQLLLASENLFFSEVQAAGRKSKSEDRGKAGRRIWPAPAAPFFTKRDEKPHAGSRAFRWDYWAKQ